MSNARHLIAAFSVALCCSAFDFRDCDAAESDQLEFFESKIRPVLVEHCYECHNTADAAEGEFAADQRARMRRGSVPDALIVPGAPDQSRLIAILRHEIPGLEMPDGGPKLDEGVVRDFETWIQSGAFDPRDQPPTAEERSQTQSWTEKLRRRKQWWSFQPIADVNVPSGTANHPIDRFLDARIESEQLQASGKASPEVLVRRLFLSLIGLPPTVDQSKRWIDRLNSAKQSGDEAYQKEVASLVERLLESDHFGERWARHWMDWIRYAETHGSEGDPKIEGAWHYRDYLIRALNADVPYDQLVREHIAGDLLRQPRINTELGINESVIGTAHWRMVFHGFAPTDAYDERVRFTDDQINVFSKAFLGLTVSCARCHDHKFDAISQADYYALFGILESCRPGRAVIDLPDRLYSVTPKLDELKGEIKAAVAEQWLRSLDDLADRLRGDDFAKVEAGFLAPLHAIKQSMSQGHSFDEAWQQYRHSHGITPDAIDSSLISNSQVNQEWDLGKNTGLDRWFGHRETHRAKAGQFAIESQGDSVITGIYPAGIYSHLHSQKLPGRFTSDDVTLQAKQKVWVESIGGAGATNRYVVYDYPRNGTVYQRTNLDSTWKWRPLDVSYWEGDSIHIEAATSHDAPLLTSGQDRSWMGVRRVVVANDDWVPPKQNDELIGEFLHSADHHPKSLEDLVSMYRNYLQAAIEAWKQGNASDGQALVLNEALTNSLLENRLDHLRDAKQAVLRYRELEATIPVPTRIPALDESSPTDHPLMVRGNHKQLADPVPRRFLEAIDPTPYAERVDQEVDSGRLQLAEDCLRSDNPLTRRVIVNRIWTHLFGQGIVATPDNFGRLGEKPSHPELLDYLANQFSKDGWSIKTLIRELVLTEAWQRSSLATAQVHERDPLNRFLARSNQRRLEAETIRDQMLFVSGLLDESIYGPPVKSGVPRRSLYVSVIRNALDPFLRAFDFPEPFATVGKRSVTNVPAQSLALMNDPQVASWARSWAAKTLADTSLDTDEARLSKMFYQVTSRKVTDDELDQLKAFLNLTSSDVSRLIDRRRELDTERKKLSEFLSSQLDLARSMVNQESDIHESVQPIAAWDFTKGLQDPIGGFDARVEGGEAAGKQVLGDQALFNSQGLSVKQGSYAVAGPINRDLREKTLEAFVKLGTLDQSGGGVVTVQTENGRVFDSIVYGERQSRRWLAGSDLHRRSEDVNTVPESDAIDRAVHLMVSYHADGAIAMYRNGKPYGKPYLSSGPVLYPSGQTLLSFGVRHLPAVGNRSLSGHILRAAIYDVALDESQVALIAERMPEYLSDDDLIERLSSQQKTEYRQAQQQLSDVRAELRSLDSLDDNVQRQTYTELARSMFLLKEMIYVR